MTTFPVQVEHPGGPHCDNNSMLYPNAKREVKSANKKLESLLRGLGDLGGRKLTAPYTARILGAVSLLSHHSQLAQTQAVAMDPQNAKIGLPGPHTVFARYEGEQRLFREYAISPQKDMFSQTLCYLDH